MIIVVFANEKILVTGLAGFIGAAVIARLLEKGKNVIGLDDLNSYYDPRPKKARLKQIKLVSDSSTSELQFSKSSLENELSLNYIFSSHSPDVVIILLGILFLHLVVLFMEENKSYLF